MEKRVYIETSIPSFYFETRTEPEMIARSNWTRDWWDHHAHKYEIVASDPVLDELGHETYPNQEETLKLLEGLPFLGVNAEIIEIAKVYIANKAMPKDPVGDAMHLALATYLEFGTFLVVPVVSRRELRHFNTELLSTVLNS